MNGMLTSTSVSVRYRDEVIEPVVRPFTFRSDVFALGQAFVLMHENARPHTTRVV